MNKLSDQVINLTLKQRAALELLLTKKRRSPPAGQIHRQKREANLFPLSFAQQRLWFFDQLSQGSPYYNMPAALSLEGNLKVTALEQSVSEIVRRHESLRTSFFTIEGQPMQLIGPARAI